MVPVYLIFYLGNKRIFVVVLGILESTNIYEHEYSKKIRLFMNKHHAISRWPTDAA